MIVKEANNKVNHKHNVTHLLFDEMPDPNSLAGYVMLKLSYTEQDYTLRYNQDWHYYFIARRHFLRKKRKEHKGHWVCHYCGEKVYTIQTRGKGKINKNIRNSEVNSCITIDHKIPKKECLDITDTSNFLECCRSCNTKKADTSYQVFKQTFKKESRWKKFLSYFHLN